MQYFSLMSLTAFCKMYYGYNVFQRKVQIKLFLGIQYVIRQGQNVSFPLWLLTSLD